MPWRSKQASKNAVRGCFGAAGKNKAKRAKCRKMAHEARIWRGDKRKKKAARKGRRKSKRRARR